MGKLNNVLGTEFIVDTQGVYAGEYYNAGSGSGQYLPGDFYPAFGNTEESIYAEMYKIDYYEKKIRDALNGIMEVSDTVDWIELSEGDTRIRRNNKNEVAKTYRSSQSEARKELQKLIGYYRENRSLPRQVAGDDATNP